jgi:predicted unusual protein kinase regulating ubiquinone biosynthesis (AarF/ABC1/UbiB family)
VGWLRHPELAAIVAPAVLSQFRESIRNGESLGRERSFLEVLSNYRGQTLVEYPHLLPELSTATILCWPAIKGRPVLELIELGDADALVQIASAILEQFFSLSMVDADLDLDSMIVDQNNRLHFRRLNNLLRFCPASSIQA